MSLTSWLINNRSLTVLKGGSPRSRLWQVQCLLGAGWVACFLALGQLSFQFSHIVEGLPGGSEPACQCRRRGFHPWSGKIPWRREWQSTLVCLGFPGGSDIKESACNAGDPGSIPGSGRSPGGGHGNPLQYSCLENPWAEERGGLQPMGSQSQTRLSEHACMW